MLRAAFIDVGGTLWSLASGPPTDQQHGRLQAVLGLAQEQAVRLAHALNRAVASWESPTVLEQDTDALIGDVLRQFGMANVSPRAVREAMCVPASDGAALRLVAIIHPDHVASRTVAENIGMHSDMTTTVDDYPCVIYAIERA